MKEMKALKSIINKYRNKPTDNQLFNNRLNIPDNYTKHRRQLSDMPNLDTIDNEKISIKKGDESLNDTTTPNRNNGNNKEYSYIMKMLNNYNNNTNNKNQSSKTINYGHKTTNADAESFYLDKSENLNPNTKDRNILSYMKNIKKTTGEKTKILFKSVILTNSNNNITSPYNEKVVNDNGNESFASIHSEKKDNINFNDINTKITKNNNDIIRSIEDKINNLKFKLQQEDFYNKININKFTSNLDVVIDLVKFMNGDVINFFDTCKQMRNIILHYLKAECHSFIIRQFENVYKNIFEIKEKTIAIQKTKHNSIYIFLIVELKVDLIIRAKVLLPDSLYGNTISITNVSKCVGDKNSFRNVYKLDYKSNTSNTLWIMRELTNV